MNDEVLEKLKEEYPVGTRVELVKMDDKNAPPRGTKGTVRHIDSIGTIHINWDNGSGLGVVYGIDKVRKV